MSQRSGPFGDAVRGPALNQAVATLGSEQDLPPVSGELTTDPAAQPATADDFGHIVHRTPQYVLKPASAADISATVAWAASQGLKVAARGQGHSTYGRPMVPEGVVVDMSTLNTIHSIASDRMVVDAGATVSGARSSTRPSRGGSPLRCSPRTPTSPSAARFPSAVSAATFDALENILRGNGQWFNPHPWWLTFLPDSTAESLAGEILDQLTNDGVGPFGQVTYYPMTTEAFRTPLLRVPGGSVIFPFNLIRLPATSDQATIDQMVAQNRAFYERIRSAGGLLYPVTAMAMSKDDWKIHFGSGYPLLSSAKTKYDPQHIFTPGYEVF
jgi:FAD/FMN-containing dehydrogenase